MLLGGPPIPGRVVPYDLPGDFFRIRLITTLLETCGMFFNKGAAGKKLDVFLSLFQVCVVFRRGVFFSCTRTGFADSPIYRSTTSIPRTPCLWR